jgi:antitoxin component YwqK of YwqJK toxin-antitoxin module
MTIYQPNGLVHMELTYSDDMALIDYSLYIYNDNNQLIREYKPNDRYIVFNYHNNGQLHTKMNYKDNQLHGLYEKWFDDGKQIGKPFNMENGALFLRFNIRVNYEN